MAESHGAVPQTCRHSSLESPRNLAPISTTLAVADYTLQQRPEVQLHSGKGEGICIDAGACRANCSTHIAACPSKETSRVNPSSAATVSKSRPIEVVEKVRTPLVTSSAASPNRWGKLKGAAVKSGKEIQLRKKASRSLDRILRRGIAAGKRSMAEMGNTLKAIPDAAHKNLAAPDAAVVSVTRAVEAHSQHALLPLAALGQHRCHVRTMMLHRYRLKSFRPEAWSVEAYCG